MPQMSLTAMARRRKARQIKQQRAKQLYAHAQPHHGGKRTRKSKKNNKKNKKTRKTRKNKRKSSRRHH